MQTLGEKIAILVKAKGWQQKEFAGSIGYTAEHFSRLLKASPMSNKALNKIAKGLDLSPEELTSMPEVGRGHMPALVNEPGVAYSTRQAPRDNRSDAGNQIDFLQQEIGRLHAEIARQAEALAREQAISASLAEALKNLTGEK